MWQMGGQATGNLFAAFVGDRWGGRATLGLGFCVLSAACVVGLFVDTPMQAQLAYAFFGLSQMLAIVGKDTLVMELTPKKLQAGYLSLVALVTMVSLLSVGMLSQFLWTRGGLSALALTTVGLCFLGFLSLSWVKDPRAKQCRRCGRFGTVFCVSCARIEERFLIPCCLNAPVWILTLL